MDTSNLHKTATYLTELTHENREPVTFCKSAVLAFGRLKFRR